MGKFRKKLLAVVLLIAIADMVESGVSLGRSNSASKPPAAAPQQLAPVWHSARQFATNTVGNIRQSITG